MKILLLNDNPVVTKLVTLSAQKTSDELEIVSTIDAIKDKKYDLLIVDDAMYSEQVYALLNENITFEESLYICSRSTQEVEDFTKTLKKPFLPTDLVELFALIGSNSSSFDTDEIEDVEELEPLEMLSEDDDLNLTQEMSLDESDEISLDDELLLDDEFLLHEEDLEQGESVLDNEEAQKVKDLLDETSSGELDFDDELDLSDDELEDILAEDESEDELLLDENLEDIITEEDTEEESEGVESEDKLEDEQEIDHELDFEDELILDEDEIQELSSLDQPLEDEDKLETSKESDVVEDLETLEQEEELGEDDSMIDDDLDLQTQIENAVDELSDEDLESELDEDLLLDIATGGLDSLDSLTTRDLKLAIGEEVDEEELLLDEDSIEEISEEFESVKEESFEESDENEIEGVEALKNLLAALSDKKVAASMKGMQISINITLGGK